MQANDTDSDRLYWDEIVEQGRAAVESNDSSSWDLGKLAEQVETRYGESDLGRYADLIGVNPDTLSDYRRVTSRFRDRSRFVSFTVMRQLARIDDPNERVTLLEQAEREHWTVSRARRAIQQRLTAVPEPDQNERGSKSNIGFKASRDPIVTRFRTIASAFEALSEDEERDNAEPEDMARAIVDPERRRAVEAAVGRATQFVDKWLGILEMDVSPAEDFGA